MQNKSSITVPEIRISFYPYRKASELPLITSSSDGVKLFREHWDKPYYEIREEARLLLLSTGGRALGIFHLSTGGRSHTVMDPTIIFLIALRTPGTTGIILAHNHPSGNLKPSKADLAITKKIQAGAELVDLRLLDHYILTADTYLSMSDEGLL